MEKMTPEQIKKAQNRRKLFAAVSAVEGIFLTPCEMQELEAFDKAGMPHSQRREVIIQSLASK